MCVYRIPKDISIYKQSYCHNCNNKIKWYDLIPVVSYILFKGKCKYCGEIISIRNTLIELITGTLFLLFYLRFGVGFEFFKYITFVSILIIIGMIDLDTTDVYDNIVLIQLFLGIIFIMFNCFFLKTSFNNSLTYLYGALLGGLVFSIIVILTRSMGWGDVEVCTVCGLFLGLKLTIVMIFLSFSIGGILGLVLILLKLKSRKDYIPFVPFIALASIVTLFFGNDILYFYLLK